MRVVTENLPTASELEKKTLENNGAEAGERLSCQVCLEANAMAETTYW